MYFPVKHAEVLYILVSIKFHIGNDMDKGHYICDVFDYNTETWWNCDDSKVTKYPGYPMNVYDDLSIDKKQKKVKECVWMYQIGLCLCYILKKTFLHRASTLLLQGSQYQKRLRILRRE